MGFRIRFRVDDIPPKKDGANSMWGKEAEVGRIISLRKKAFEEMQNQGLSGSIHSRINLELTLYVPLAQLESIGDLDNFIGGICDGLQKANSRTLFHEKFHDPLYEKIHPTLGLIENDSRIMSVIARKIGLGVNDQIGIRPIYYIVVLEEV